MLYGWSAARARVRASAERAAASVLVSEKPMGVRRPTLTVHVEAGPDEQGDVVGDSSMARSKWLCRSGGMSQGQDGACEREMGLGGELSITSASARARSATSYDCSMFPWTKRVPKSATRLRTRIGVRSRRSASSTVLSRIVWVIGEA